MVSPPTSLHHQAVQVGVKVELVAVGLNRQDGCRHRVRPQGVLQVQVEASPGTAAELPQQLSIAPKGGSQHLGNGPHQLAVRNRFQHLPGDPFHKSCYPLGLTRWTKVAGLTTESQQILPGAIRTEDAGKAVAIDATLEKTIDGFFHHRAQLTVVGFIKVGVGLLKLLPIAVQTLVERGVLGTARAVDSRRYSHRLLQRPSLKKCEISCPTSVCPLPAW